MPKEQFTFIRVQPDRAPSVTDGDYPSTAGTPKSLAAEFSVHWHGGETVTAYAQVGVEFDLNAMEEYIASVRKGSPTDTHGFLYSDTMSRDEMQRMIRAGRRARNAVYGSDE